MVGVNRIASSLAALGLLAIMAACAPPRGLYDDLPPLRLATRIGIANMCTGSQSPAIRLGNLPAGSAQMRIRMSNLSVLRQTPAEWTIAAPESPNLLPIGALPGYIGPCPGDLQSFRYRIEILALGANGQPAAYGDVVVRVMSVNELAQETWRRTGRGQPSQQLDPSIPPPFDADGIGAPPARRGDDDFFRDDRTRDRASDSVNPYFPR